MNRLSITRGRQQRPIKALIYGPPGVGKSSLAARFPEPLFLDLEGGTAQLDVARVAPQVWSDVTGFLREFSRNPQGFRTLVIDGAGNLDALAAEEVCRQGGKTSIEDFAYGKGLVMVAERFRNLLLDLDAVHAAGLHVVILAHAQVSRVEPPDAVAPYDTFAPKFGKQTGPLVVAWADLVGHADYWVDVEKRKGMAKGKATGGKERVLWVENSAARVAKNRYGLPECIALDIEALAPCFGETPATAPAPVQQAPAEQPAAVSEQQQQQQQGEDINLDEVFDEDAGLVWQYLVHLGWLTGEQGLNALDTKRKQSVVTKKASLLAKAREHAAKNPVAA